MPSQMGLVDEIKKMPKRSRDTATLRRRETLCVLCRDRGNRVIYGSIFGSVWLGFRRTCGEGLGFRF